MSKLAICGHVTPVGAAASHLVSDVVGCRDETGSSTSIAPEFD